MYTTILTPMMDAYRYYILIPYNLAIPLSIPFNFPSIKRK